MSDVIRFLNQYWMALGFAFVSQILFGLGVGVLFNMLEARMFPPHALAFCGLLGTFSLVAALIAIFYILYVNSLNDPNNK